MSTFVVSSTVGGPHRRERGRSTHSQERVTNLSISSNHHLRNYLSIVPSWESMNLSRIHCAVPLPPLTASRMRWGTSLDVFTSLLMKI